jgi:hypothetical protein
VGASAHETGLIESRASTPRLEPSPRELEVLEVIAAHP